MSTPKKTRSPREIDLEELKALRAQGLTVVQLADHFGVNHQTIIYRLKREGLTLADITPPNVRLVGRITLDIEDVKRLREQGHSIVDIAKELGVSFSTVYNRLRSEGLSTTSVTPKDAGIIERGKLEGIEVEELKRLRAQGFTLAQLGNHYGVSATSIRNFLKRKGLTLTDITPPSMSTTFSARARDFEIEDVKRLREKGYKVTQIARELGVDASVIYSRLRYAGLTIEDITPEGTVLQKTEKQKKSHVRIFIDVEEIKKLRAQGLTLAQIGNHYGVSAPSITNVLKRNGLTLADITPPSMSTTFSARVHDFEIEDVKRLREQGYKVTQIARELGVDASVIYSRLRYAGLTIEDITPEGTVLQKTEKQKKSLVRIFIDVEEIKQLRAQGFTLSRIARHFGVSDSTITNILKRNGLTLADITPEGYKPNPLQKQGSTRYKAIGLGVGAAVTASVDYALNKTTDLSDTKRHLISGGAATTVGLGVYATTKREDALWAVYGSVVATVGQFIFDKIRT